MAILIVTPLLVCRTNAARRRPSLVWFGLHIQLHPKSPLHYPDSRPSDTKFSREWAKARIHGHTIWSPKILVGKTFGLNFFTRLPIRLCLTFLHLIFVVAPLVTIAHSPRRATVGIGKMLLPLGPPRCLWGPRASLLILNKRITWPHKKSTIYLHPNDYQNNRSLLCIFMLKTASL